MRADRRSAAATNAAAGRVAATDGPRPKARARRSGLLHAIALPTGGAFSRQSREGWRGALKRAIYTGRVGPAQARRADALSLLANIVMAWNMAQMQAVLDRWANRRQIVPPELTGRIAPTRLEGMNLRGVFRFPLERLRGGRSCRHKLQRKRALAGEIDRANRPSAAVQRTNRNSSRDKHLRASSK